eukprot:TCALIF_06671-PA protein Name:"Protein of unknown function" AED:0.04 eAED:0.04 QI:0/0.66/0.75/0.75/1/1/4/64/478
MVLTDNVMACVSIKGVLAVIGGFLINLILGVLFSFGNIMPYIASYMREVAGIPVSYSDFASVNMVFVFTNGFVLAFAPLILIPFVGNKIVLYFSCLCFSVGPVLARFAMDKSLGLVILTYGFIQAIGNMALIPTYTIPMRWFPNHRGSIMGLVTAGYGLSTLALSPIQILIVNPDNVSPIKDDSSEDMFFRDPEVLARVPTLLITLSIVYAVVLFIACLFMFEPASESDEAIESSANKDQVDQRQSRETIGVKWNRIKETLIYFKSNILPCKAYYFILFTRFAVVICTISLTTYYKAFALTFIQSDFFITSYVGALSGVSSSMSSIIYGFVLDWVPYKFVVSFMMVILGIAIGTLYITTLLNEIWFVLWMHAIFLNMQGIFAVIPAKSNEIFGETYGGVVVGTTALSDIIVTGMIELFGSLLLTGLQINYLHYFLFVCIGPTIGLFCTLFLPATEEDQKRLNRMLCREEPTQSTMKLT